ncbi:MAG: hypothetical protein BGO38_14490 [Cellulomonas sp. 73-145]|uniref:M20/M25/M40 family metallo-hydrolase n=1 Tax=Cellulomonas sp. 73-145 TaxID=1895739 RepID=UPI00092B6EBE|nr:M20/M25/M40 family metallo-hydrolase [Cellulomonas sp. 73-145]OJV58622.1 MAG: hypothetical protein BGO38_14490 [Cellulomonas sp. 73-145]
MTTDLGAALRDATLASADADLERLVAYARHETPTGDRDAIDAFADTVATDAVALGATARRLPLPHGDALLMEHPGSGARADLRPALLLGHLDTVHPVGSLAGAVPLHTAGELLHGPGVHDMKGGLVVVLAAWAALAAVGAPARAVRLLLTPDEEIGSPSSGNLVTAQAGQVAYALGLEPPHRDGALKTSRRGSTRWRLQVTGRAAHAALDPESGVNAIDELVDQLLVLRAVAAEHPDVLVNVGTVDGGGRTNVVPDAAEAEVGLRFVDAATETVVLDRLAALRPVRDGAVVAPRVVSRRPAWGPSTATERLLEAVAEAGRTVGQDVVGRPAAGAADTNLSGAAGIPSLDGFAPVGGGAHAAHEHVLIASVAQRAALLAAVLATA